MASDTPALRSESDVLSLAPLRAFYRRHRTSLLLGLSSIFLSGLALVGSVWWITPVTRVLSIQIYLGFLGAQDGKYPNDLPFSPEELLEPTVLRAVYDQYQLSPSIEFSDFQRALSISQDSKNIEDIIREYESRFRDSKLGGPDRQALEAEYRSRLRNASSALYNLSWYEAGTTAPRVPDEVKAKVLLDISKTWAERAIGVKEVLLFPSLLPGLNPVPPTGSAMNLEFFSALDARARTLAEGLTSMDKLPGANQVSLKDGTTTVDLLLRLRAFREQTLPSVQEILLTQLESDRELRKLEGAVELQLKFRETRAGETQQRLSAQVDSYRDFLAGRPGASGLTEEGGVATNGANLDETLLARILGLAQSGADAEYLKKMLREIEGTRLQLAQEDASVMELRQNLEILRTTTARQGAERPSAAPLQPPPPQEDREDPTSSAVLQDSSAQLGRLLDSARQLLAAISQSYLGTQGQLVTVSSGLNGTQIRPLGIARLGLAFTAWTVLGTSALILLLLLHDRTRSIARSVQKQ